MSFKNRISQAVPGGKMPGSGSQNTADTPLDVIVQIGGKTADPKTVFVERLQTRHAVNEIPSATVVFSVPQSAPGDYSALDHLMSFCKVGQPAVVKVGKLTVFEGVVGAVQVNAGASERRVNVRLKHKLQALKSTQHCRVWKPQQDAALIRDVLKEHHITKNTVTLSEHSPVQRFQWNCPDWQFIRALLGLHGAWLWPHADGSVKIQAPQSDGTSHRISAVPAPGGAVLLDAEWRYSGLNQSKTVTQQSWDLSKQAAMKKTAKAKYPGHGGLAPAEVSALGSESSALLMGQWDDAGQQAAADSWQALQQAQAVRAQFTIAGCSACQVGDTVSLEKFGAHLNGQSVVTRVEYFCDVSTRMGKTIIGVGLDEDAASVPPLPVPSGLVMGLVAAFKADPKGKWNRLPVTIPALGKEILWARVGHLYASKESGVTFYPEEGDEVALGFTGGDPVIVASLHNPKRVAAIEPSAKNTKKGIVLRHEGNRAELSFDRDKHTMLWALGADKTPEQQMTIDKEKGVVVANQKGDVKFEVKAGGVDWTTKQKIALTADEQVTMTGKTGVMMSSDKDVSLEAKAHLNGQGKTGVQMACGNEKLALTPEKASLSAGQIEITGDMTVKIQGKESVSAQGAKVNLSGDAEVAIAGARVAVKGSAEVVVQGAEVKVTGQVTDVGGTGVTSVKGSMVNLG